MGFVKSRTRSLIAATLTFAGVFMLGNSAFAEDYSVDFGADNDRGRDAGTLHCQFGKTCDGKMESLGLEVSVLIHRRDRAAQVRMSSIHAGCCYFAYAKDSIVVDTRTPLSLVPIFKGTPSKGGLFIENERVGGLYLKFYFHGNNPDSPGRLEKSTWLPSKENLCRRQITLPFL